MNVNGEFVLISDEDCYLLGCHLFVNNSLKLEANGTDEFAFFDCNIADPGDDYLSGTQEYICESQDFIKHTNESDWDLPRGNAYDPKPLPSDYFTGDVEFQCVDQADLQYIDDNCIPRGCTTNIFCDVNDDDFILVTNLVGDVISVDCNLYDLANNYNHGNHALECESHGNIANVGDNCVLPKCEFDAYYDRSEAFFADCNVYTPEHPFAFVEGDVELQCTGESEYEFVSDSQCIQTNWVFVNTPSHCATDASLTCDGTDVNPYPTIEEADNHIGYQTQLSNYVK